MSSARNEITKNIPDNNLGSFKLTYKGIIQFFLSEIGFIIILSIILIFVSVIPKYHSKKKFLFPRKHQILSLIKTQLF